MNRVLIAMCLLLVGANTVNAQTIAEQMKTAYQNFKSLQIYLRDEESFSNPQNDKKIAAHLDQLKKSFHKADSVSSKYRSEAGFMQTLNVVNATLEDASSRFSAGKKDYALWRLRTLSNHCISCHTAHNARLPFDDKEDMPPGLNQAEQAEFLLSTRQFQKAKNLILKALTEKIPDYFKIQLLRNWLVVELRSAGDLKEAGETLTKLLPELNLPLSEQEEVTAWVSSLNRLAADKMPPTDFISAEALMREALTDDPLNRRADPVLLLRATGLLHTILASKDLKGKDRARALYLLGRGYSELTPFFIDELPEMYLELCINEFGGTSEAKRAFKLYEDLIITRFTGSSGQNIPTEVELQLLDLRKKANGLPNFEGRI